MAKKAKKKYELPSSEYMDSHDGPFLIVAIPTKLVRRIGVVREALIQYAPGENKGQFSTIREAVDWVDSIKDLIYQPDGK